MSKQPKLRFRTMQQLADAQTVSRQCMHNWLKEGHPKKKNGYYSKIESDEWIAKYKPKSGKQDGNGQATLLQVQLELKQEDLLEKRRVRAEFERRMVDGEEMRKQGVAAAKQITAVITRIPAQIGSILGVEAQRRAEVIVQEALNVLKENPLGEITN